MIVGFVLPLNAAAQEPAFVGSEEERYLRWLETAGVIPTERWTLRPFSQRQLRRITPPDTAHPWAGRRGPLTAHRSPLTGIDVQLLPASLTTSFNSSFPFGFNDGPVWQGKGFTTSFSAGFAARWGPVSLTVAPLVFVAQNADFTLQDNGFSDSLRFANGRFPQNIDAPQRFGDGAYTRVDPGQSTLRIDLPIVTAGISTANQWWGPAREHPIILGNNAPGFPHVFFGTSEPLDLKVVTLHGRLVWGDLRQSDFTRNAPPAHRRFMSGIVGTLTIAGVDGLELGATRFFHTPWPEDGLRASNFTRPFEGILKAGLPDDVDARGDNQLASLFFRWTFPKSGFELYGEYGREDHSVDLRDFIVEPDHAAGFLLGFGKTWGRTASGFWALRAERLDLQLSQVSRVRSQGPFYVHSQATQGHTHRGQILGSAFGLGGGATTLTLERFRRDGRWGVTYRRLLQQDRGTFLQSGVPDTNAWDVIHSLGADVVLFRGRYQLSGGASLLYNLNRNLRDDDELSVHAFVGVRVPLGAGSKEQGAGSRERGAGSTEQGAGSREQGAGSRAQVAGSEQAPVFGSHSKTVLPETSGLGSEQSRLDQLLGYAPVEGQLIRSPSSLVAPVPGEASRLRASVLAPRVDFVWNSTLPYSLNQGNLWAGVGGNTRLTAGVRGSWGPLHVILAPELTWSQNRPFPMPDLNRRPHPLPAGWDTLTNPWHAPPATIDQPTRFGADDFATLHPGQSTLAARYAGFAAGISTENQWWGPGIKNALVLSDNGPGFPHLFLRTDRPIETPVGGVEAKWLVGGLSESDYFDDDPENDLRSLSALALAWYPRWVPGLSIGFARAVYEPVDGWDDIPAKAFDVVGRNPRHSDSLPGNQIPPPGRDQIFSLFARWVYPKSGFEVYTEWSRLELPRSLRDFLEAPGHTQGYTLGLQWAKPLGGRGRSEAAEGEQVSSSRRDPQSAIRIQAEHTYLERGTTFRQRPLRTYYTSPAVPQGYTNRGRVLGAAIGPGASSHWLAVDYVAPRWQIGLFGRWVRWDNDALFNLFPPVTPCMHDVTLLGGVRGGYFGSVGAVTASLSSGLRRNIHFQNTSLCGEFDRSLAVDVPNTTLELRYTLPL